jgi:hypothetical protein
VTRLLSVTDISSYLAATGWRRAPEDWRGAAVWESGDIEVLVPPSDDLGDTDLRIRELLARLTLAEARDPEDIARDISSPLIDAATYRALPGIGGTDLSLSAGAHAVDGIRRMVATAARTVVEGPQRTFTGAASIAVSNLLGSARLATSWRDGFTLTVMVPLVSAPALGRSVVTQLYDATSAIEESVEQNDDGTLDGAAAAGVSAQFCAALSDLAGDGRRDPFELGFRWAHRFPTELPPRTLTFPEGAGERIRHAARRLRRLDLSGPATVVGRIESLHDDPEGARWRVRVRGELRTHRTTGGRRGVWVRLHGPSSYDVAVIAHREGRLVRVTGFRDPSGTRQDLAVPPDGLVILDHPDQYHPTH